VTAYELSSSRPSKGQKTTFDILNLAISPLTQASKLQTASSKIMDPVLFEGLSWATALVVNGDKHPTGTVIL